MSENNEHEQKHDDGHHINYFGIYVVLIILFLISVAGPEIGQLTGLRWITLVTAFGIAFVKANLVIQNFMHLRWEKNLMKWLLATSLILLVLMVAGVSPDVLNHEGNNWENVAAKAAVERGVDGEVEEATVEVAAAVGGGAFSAESAFRSVCSTCHGTAGDGNGPAGAALDPPPADFTDAAFWADRDKARVMTVIDNGAASVGGSSLMAPFGGLYSDEQISELADYILTLAPEGAVPGGE